MINGGAIDITGAFLILGHLRMIMVATGAVILILCVCWAIEEWGVRKAAGWCGLASLGLVIVVGLL